jgi:acid phosphatase
MSCLRLSAAVGVAAVLLCAYSWSPAFFTQNAALANWAPLTRELSGWHHHESHHAALQGPQHQARPISDQAWNIHHHLGGNGPWISNADENNNDIRTPTGCEIEQVHILSRHAERYPTMKAGGRLLDLLIRLHRSDVMMVGDLEFANDWKFFTSDPMRDFDQLTRSGPYAGTLAAFTTGVRMRTRYGHLLDQHFSTRQLLNLWAGDSQRVIETAEHFAAGLLGLGWKSRAILHIVPEEPSTGGDTLTPGKACLNYIQDVQNGRESGYAALATFTDTAFAATAARLSKFIKTTSSQNFKLSTVDVYAMQELCGFEILTRGSSPWCDIFTKDEWERFAYARDLLHFYRAGPGGKYSRTMGALYLNTTAELMLQGPEAGPLFFSL